MIRSFIWEKKVSRYCTLKSIKKITLVQSLIPLKRKKKRKNISFLLKLYLELGNGMKWNGIWKSKSQKKKKKKNLSLKCFSRSLKLVNPAKRQLTVWFSKRFLERTQQEHHHYDNVWHMMSVLFIRKRVSN